MSYCNGRNTPSELSGSELNLQFFKNAREIKMLREEIENQRIIAKLNNEIHELKQQLGLNSGGKKRSNRRKHAMRNKKTRKGSRMHKKMH